MPLVLAKLAWRGVKTPAYWRRWSERFGYFASRLSRPSLWVHAVSVGEVQAATPLIEALLKQYPESPVVVTTMTPTGLAQVQRRFGDRVLVGHLPYDLPWFMARFLKRIQPRIAIIMETELWPNLLHTCASKHIPVMIANGRLSPRSTKGYKRVLPFTRWALRQVTRVAAQSTDDASRFMEIGADADKVIVTKNIKFDMAEPPSVPDAVTAFRAALGEGRTIFLAASTHAGEDALVLDAYARILSAVPGAVLLVVPRHPERFDEVASLIQKRGYRLTRRSQLTVGDQRTQVFLGDTMGELLFFYRTADLCFVGGSLVPTGGHNLLEPASVGVASLTGPHTFNFRDITANLIEAGACRQVDSVDQLAAEAIKLLSDSAQRQQMGERGRRVIVENRGATALLMQEVAKLLAAVES